MFKDFIITGVLNEDKKIIKDKNNNTNIVYKINNVINSSWNNFAEYSIIHIFKPDEYYYSVEHMLYTVINEENGADYIEKYCKKHNIQDINGSTLLTTALKALLERYMITYEDLEILFYIVCIYKKYNIKHKEEDAKLFIDLLNDEFNNEFKLLILFIALFLYNKDIEHKDDKLINSTYKPFINHNDYFHKLKIKIYETLINKEFIKESVNLFYFNCLLSTLLKFCMDNKNFIVITAFKSMLTYYVDNIEKFSYRLIDYIIKFIKYTKHSTINERNIKYKVLTKLYNKLILSNIITAKQLSEIDYNYYKNLILINGNKELINKAKYNL